MESEELTTVLAPSFYNRAPQIVGRELLGAVLVRREHGLRLAGKIVEAEAYHGEQDLACHARHGLTPRTRIMYGPPGHAYVYFTYGNHWMLNAVTEPEGMPSAVLLRAIWPVEGLDRMAELRPPPRTRRASSSPGWIPGWTDGPGKLCQAMAISGQLNGTDLTDPLGELFIEAGEPVPDDQIIVGPRVGIQSVPEPWLSIPWRYRLKFEQASHQDAKIKKARR